MELMSLLAHLSKRSDQISPLLLRGGQDEEAH